MGKIYKHRDWDRYDEFVATEWFEKGAEKGYVPAQLQVGKRLFFGIGSKPDRKVGVIMPGRAALNDGLEFNEIADLSIWDPEAKLDEKALRKLFDQENVEPIEAFEIAFDLYAQEKKGSVEVILSTLKDESLHSRYQGPRFDQVGLEIKPPRP